MSALQRVTAMALVALVGGLGGFVAYRSVLRAPPPIAVLDRTQAAPATATEDSAAPPKAVPEQRLPDVRLPDLSGTPHSLRDYLGQALIVNFWATWCAPCRREMPLLEQLRRRYGPQQLQIVGIAVDFRSAVQDFQSHGGVGYPLLIGEDHGLDAAQQFGMETVLPFSVFAEPDGRIVAIKIGELHRNEADYILGEMRAVTDGHTSLPQARADIAAQLKQFAVQRARAGATDS